MATDAAAGQKLSVRDKSDTAGQQLVAHVIALLAHNKYMLPWYTLMLLRDVGRMMMMCCTCVFCCAGRSVLLQRGARLHLAHAQRDVESRLVIGALRCGWRNAITSAYVQWKQALQTEHVNENGATVPSLLLPFTTSNGCLRLYS